MKVRSLFLLLFVAMPQLGFCAETNAVSPELHAWLDLRLHQLRVRQVSHMLTNAQFNEGKLLVIETVTGADKDGDYRSVREDGQREAVVYGGVSRKIPEKLKDLTKDDLQRLRAALAELPSATTNVGTNRTIVIGFRSGTNWLNRIYVDGEDPAALLKVQKILLGSRNSD